jgi:hypothetical protein
VQFSLKERRPPDRRIYWSAACKPPFLDCLKLSASFGICLAMIVDSEEKIQSFLPVLDKMITGGLVTMEKIRALHYRGAVSDDAR